MASRRARARRVSTRLAPWRSAPPTVVLERRGGHEWRRGGARCPDLARTGPTRPRSSMPPPGALGGMACGHRVQPSAVVAAPVGLTRLCSPSTPIAAARVHVMVHRPPARSRRRCGAGLVPARWIPSNPRHLIIFLCSRFDVFEQVDFSVISNSFASQVKDKKVWSYLFC